MTRRKRLRIPVISRLTWAWLTACFTIVLVTGALVTRTYFGPDPERMKLAINELETLARAERVSEDRLAPPGDVDLAAPERDRLATRSVLRANAPGEESDDLLVYPDREEVFAQNEYDTDDGDGEIRIMIDGSDANTSRATGATLASIRSTPDKISIQDPDPELLRSTPLGKIPRISPDGRKAVTTYARPFRSERNDPPVAIIVGGLGLHRGLTERAIDDLPAEISLAFAPYAKDLPFWTEKARRAGHEVLIELPMEGHGPNQAALGAAALLTTRSSSENLQRLDWLMSRFGGYFAATNYLGSKFSSNDEALQPILQKLRDSGIGYIDDTGAAARVAKKTGVPAIRVNRIIPPSPDDNGRNAVRRELRALTTIAAAEGAALGKTYAYAATLDEIIRWADKAEENGIVLAPASTILQKRSVSR